MKYIKEDELKLIIPKSIYDKIYETGLHFNEKTVKQTNYYFDTDDFLLAEKNYALRIREKNACYEATLKTGRTTDQNTTSSREYNKSLTEYEALSVLEKEKHISEVFPELIDLCNLSKKQVLVLQGSLTTYRTSFKPISNLYAIELDRNIYLGIEDYEIEWEYTGKDQLDHIVAWLKSIGINATDFQTLAKFGRFMDEILKK